MGTVAARRRHDIAPDRSAIAAPRYADAANQTADRNSAGPAKFDGHDRRWSNIED